MIDLSLQVPHGVCRSLPFFGMLCFLGFHTFWHQVQGWVLRPSFPCRLCVHVAGAPLRRLQSLIEPMEKYKIRQHLVHLYGVCGCWARFEATVRICANERRVFMATSPWQRTQIVKLFVENWPSWIAQLQQPMGVAQQPCGLWMVCTVCALMECTSFHTSLLCCPSDFLQVPDASGHAVSRTAQIFWVLPSTNGVWWSNFQDLRTCHDPFATNLSFLLELAFEPRKAVWEISGSDRPGSNLANHTARDHVEHGGDMMMASKSPCFTLFEISSNFSSSYKSWPSLKMRSTSTISNPIPLAVQSCWMQLRTSLLRGAPEKRYSTLKRLLGLGDTCIDETGFTFSQSPAPAFGVAVLLVSLPPDLHDDLGWLPRHRWHWCTKLQLFAVHLPLLASSRTTSWWGVCPLHVPCLSLQPCRLPATQAAGFGEPPLQWNSLPQWW